MKRLLATCAACVVLGSGVWLSAQSNAEAEKLMETARRAAVIERDLRKAIDLYRGIADRFKDQPSIAVPALLQMAQHQEDLGEAQARQTYERIVRDYNGASEYVARAREGLAGQPGPSGGDVRQRRLIAGDPDGTLQFSAGASMASDGGALAVIDWFRSGDIGTQEVPGGAIRRLMVKKGTYLGDATGESGTWTMLSPDRGKVVFRWNPGLAKSELRVVDTTGRSESRLLFREDEDDRGVTPGAWAPDGRSVFVVRHRADGAYLSRVWVGDGRVEVVRPLEQRFPPGGGWGDGGDGSRPSVSPDGRYVAYSAFATNPNPPRVPRIPSGGEPVVPERTAIYVVAADGSGPETLVAAGGDTWNQFPVWADESHLLFLSDRPVNNTQLGEAGLWWVEIRNGRPTGPPSPARQPIGRAFPLGMTRSGSYYYIRDRMGDEVFTIPMNWSGSMDRTMATRLTDRAPDSNLDAVWSPDGRRIAFKRRRTPHSGGGLYGGDLDLVVRSQETGDERVYSEGFVGSAPIIWTRDGRSILTGALTAGRGSRHIQYHRLDLDSGRSSRIDTSLRVGTFLESRGLPGALAADDRTLYVRDWDQEEGTALIVAFDLTTSDKRVIWSKPVSDSRLVSAPALSQDGKMLAFVVQEESGYGHLVRVGVDGTDYREIAANLDRPGSPQWAEGGRTILFADRSAGRHRLMRVAAGGRPPQFTGLAVPDRFSYHLSPGGSQLLFSEHFSNELWAIDNVASLWGSAP